MEFSPIPYKKSIDRNAFECGLHPALNTYIAQQANQDEKLKVSRAFMLVEDGQLIGTTRGPTPPSWSPTSAKSR